MSIEYGVFRFHFYIVFIHSLYTHGHYSDGDRFASILRTLFRRWFLFWFSTLSVVVVVFVVSASHSFDYIRMRVHISLCLCVFIFYVLFSFGRRLKLHFWWSQWSWFCVPFALFTVLVLCVSLCGCVSVLYRFRIFWLRFLGEREKCHLATDRIRTLNNTDTILFCC